MFFFIKSLTFKEDKCAAIKTKKKNEGETRTLSPRPKKHNENTKKMDNGLKDMPNIPLTNSELCKSLKHGRQN